MDGTEGLQCGQPAVGRRRFCLCAVAVCVGMTAGCGWEIVISNAKQTTDEAAMACCGIDCTGCGIRQAALDPEKAKQEAEAWRQRGHEDARPEWFQCRGCHGPDELVWSGQCAIRKCCLKDKRLANCSQCADFPCAHVVAFESDGHPHHRAAIARLRSMREADDMGPA